MNSVAIKSFAVATAAAVAFVGVPGSAHAAKDVTPKQLPSMAQVAGAVSGLAGAERRTSVMEQISSPLPDCEATWVNVKSSISASYVPKLRAGENRMDSLYGRGVRVQTARFGTAAKAKSWIKKAKGHVKNCAQPMTDGLSMRRVKAATVGTDSVAAFVVSLNGWGGKAVRGTTVLARSGKTVTAVEVYGTSNKPRIKPTLKVARIALKKAK